MISFNQPISITVSSTEWRFIIMCYVIYLTLIGLFLIYSDTILSEHALSATSGGDEWMIVALGWEIIPAIWPAFVMALILSSAVTFIVTRKIYSVKK